MVDRKKTIAGLTFILAGVIANSEDLPAGTLGGGVEDASISRASSMGS
jgi:hypothetical protein